MSCVPFCLQVRMVAALPLDELGAVNFNWACRVMNVAWFMLPLGIYRHVETRAFEEVDAHDIAQFAIRFEEILFVHFPDYYDAIVQEVI